jgi:tetratricopeptide (TPR) repeat protein
MKKLLKFEKSAIVHYEKLINFFANKGKKDLRSMNLEYAFLLWRDGRIEQAKKLYQQFIQKYPTEFTFYYSASKMYYTLKDYTKARELAEKAFEYSYGDNRIRSMERLVWIMADQGMKPDAILRGNNFLKTVKSPAGLNIRTQRYIDGLKETIAKIEKEKNEGVKK